MGTNAPSEFSRLDKLLLNGMLQFDTNCNEDEIFEYIYDTITGCQCLPQDFELIKCSGKMCCVSQVFHGVELL